MIKKLKMYVIKYNNIKIDLEFNKYNKIKIDNTNCHIN